MSQPTARRALPADTVGSASPWTGTGTLLRLYLRRDRITVPVWVLAVAASVAGSVEALKVAYPDQASLDARAALLDNPAAIVMSGPLFALEHYTLGAMVANELMLYVLVAVAIMGILLMVRHTRAEEEAGRLELLRSRPVGRHAAPTAAFIAVTVATVLVGAGTALGLIATAMPVADSLAFGLATTLTSLVFAATAAVTAQLTEHARTASGTALSVLAAAFLVRGMGDVIDSQGSWLSWFSPIAWAQQTRIFVDVRWWPLAVSLAAIVVLMAMAAALAQRRDLGAGLRPPTPGRSEASTALASPAGLAERLLRGSLIAWATGTFLFAVAMGALADSIRDAVADIPMVGDVLGSVGTEMVEAFAGLILTMVLLIVTAFGVSGILRLRGEESSGRLEQLLAAGASRPGLLAGWSTSIAGQVLFFSLLVGLGTATGVWLGTGEGRWFADVLAATLLHLPAVAVTMALAIALFGIAPRLAGAVWALIVWAAFVLFLGPLLQLPDWTVDLSPFAHVPVPGGDADAPALLVQTVLAVVLVGVGLLAFRRRDLTPG